MAATRHYGLNVGLAFMFLSSSFAFNCKYILSDSEDSHIYFCYREMPSNNHMIHLYTILYKTLKYMYKFVLPLQQYQIFMHTMLDTELVVTMETSQSLSIESFSYSWLVNIKPSFEKNYEEPFGASVDDLEEAYSFIEMDPNLPASRRFLFGSRDFKFDFPKLDSPVTLSHADELISNGFLMPLLAKPKKIESYDDVPYTTPATPVYSHADLAHRDSKVRCSSFGRCRKASKRILKKYMEFFTPVFQKFGGRSCGSKNEVYNGKKQEESRRFICSAPTSPRISMAYSVDNWRKSCDYESSINEAVLHCKRSIGK